MIAIVFPDLSAYRWNKFPHFNKKFLINWLINPLINYITRNHEMFKILILCLYTMCQPIPFNNNNSTAFVNFHFRSFQYNYIQGERDGTSSARWLKGSKISVKNNNKSKVILSIYSLFSVLHNQASVVGFVNIAFRPLNLLS